MKMLAIEFIKILSGIFLLILPGYFISFSLSKKMNGVERILFGFGVDVVFLSLLIIILSSISPLSAPIFYILYGAFLTISVIPFFYSIRQLKFEKKNILKYGILFSILIFVFYMTFFPHIKYNYYLPFHGDEWVHWAYTREFSQTGTISLKNPFTGTGKTFDVEIGFHVFLASLKWLGGASLRTIFVFMPSFISVFTAMAAFCIGERDERKFGLEGAFMVSFVPTTVRFLGPSFLVPVSLGLFLLLFTLWILSRDEMGYVRHAILFLIIIFSIFMHLPSMAAVIVAATSYAIFEAIDKKFLSAALILFISILPIMLPFFFMHNFYLYLKLGLKAMLGSGYKQTLPLVKFSFSQLTKIIWLIFFVSAGIAAWKGKKLEKVVLLSASIFILLILLYEKYKHGVQVMADRSFLYAYLMITLLAAYGIAYIKEFSKNLLIAMDFLPDRMKLYLSHFRIPRKKLVKIFQISIAIMLLVLVSAFAIPVHNNMSYYRMIKEKDFENFEWISRNINRYRDANHSFEKAAILPPYASIFSAVTGIYTISCSSWPIYGKDKGAAMYEFLLDGCKNASFLAKYGLSVVYGDCNCNNLTKIHDKTYLFYGIPPEAKFYFYPKEAKQGEKLYFVSNSTSPYSNITSWIWDFGDGNKSNGICTLKFGEKEFVKGEAEMNSSFTVEMWIMPYFAYNDNKTHMWFYWGNKSGYVAFMKHSNGRIYFVVKKDRWKAAFSTVKYTPNRWHHFVAAYDNGNFYLYWDGRVVASNRGGNIIQKRVAKFRIGYGFDGLIRDVRIYNRFLPLQDVENNYHGNITMNGLVAWWKFNEGYGNITHDAICGYEAEIHGCTWTNYASHVYEKSGKYRVKLIVKNEYGMASTASKEIVVESYK